MFNEYQERILKGLEDLDDKEKELRLRVIKEAFSWSAFTKPLTRLMVMRLSRIIHPTGLFIKIKSFI